MKKVKKITQLPDYPLNLRIVGQGAQGDLIAEVVGGGFVPKREKIFVIENKKIKPALVEGDEFIGTVFKHQGHYAVKPITRTLMKSEQKENFYGIVAYKNGMFYVSPAEKNQRTDYLLSAKEKVKNGDFVRFELVGEQRFKKVKILKNFGTFDFSKALAPLILEKYEIPYLFDPRLEKELQNLPLYDKKQRLNLTSVPLVTIDGEEAKDFDDAVYAKKINGGFELIVAIADVSFYVRDGSVLDQEAYQRGNSVYLPNKVIPMLPEKLCNDLCSLRPGVERACIACQMVINDEGELQTYQFHRAVMKSAARLTYQEVQAGLDGKKSPKIAPIFKKVILPLFEAYQALDKARKKRGALELETTEIKIKTDKDGHVLSVAKVENLTANRIIEEFMIAANVAAALTLKNKSLPVMYRVHDRPQKEKLEDIKPLLQELKLKLPEAEALLPQHFNRVLNLCEKKGYAQGIGEMILRLQAQAKYTPKNIGHFGLGLPDYVHFTSPIRRYADLLIHRALVRVCSLPEGGGLAERFTLCQFEEIGNHLSETERRAVNAERDVTARLLSSYLVVMEGQILDVKVSGVSNAGVFVCVDCCGAEGLIPMSSLPDDDYDFVLGNMGLRGKFCGLSFLLGESCKAKLLEASPITGGLIFKYWDPQEGDGYYEKGNKGCALSTKKVAKKQKTIKNKKKIAQDSINNKLKTKKKSKKGEKKK